MCVCWTDTCKCKKYEKNENIIFKTHFRGYNIKWIKTYIINNLVQLTVVWILLFPSVVEV